jgi:FkbM family methyltransferase
MRLPHALRRSLYGLLRDTPLIYVDCGARAARLPKAFRNLRNTRYIGIDADADECVRLNQSARPGHLYLPAVLGSSSRRDHFHVTRAPACSSLLRPDHEFLSEFGHIAEGFAVERQIDVETTPLDTCLASNDVDYADVVELDTQGTELDVLKGATRMLQDSVVAVQAEVEFAPMYAGQPLFADVDAFMRAREFQLFDLSRYRVRRSTVDAAVATRGQLLWGHALYLRDHRRPQPAELSARLAVVATLLNLPDLAVCILDGLALEQTDKSLQNAVRRARGAICASITPRGFRKTLDHLAMMQETVAIRLFGGGPARRRGVAVWRD